MRLAQLLLYNLCCLALFGQEKLEASGIAAEGSTSSSDKELVKPEDENQPIEDRKIEYMVGLWGIEAAAPKRQGRTVKMVAISGQEFNCILPSESEETVEGEEEENVQTKLSKTITQALKDKCIVKSKGYWSYEVCFFKGITQFHQDQASRTEFLLGSYRPEFDEYPIHGDPPSPDELSARRKIRESLPYSKNYDGLAYAQRYVGGTSGRRSIVQFVCRPNMKQHSVGDIVEITEAKEHHYEVTIATHLACTDDFEDQSKRPLKELLRPLQSQCVYMNQGWWNYEFCFNQHVRQFHLETVNSPVKQEGNTAPATATQGQDSPVQMQTKTVTTVEFFLGKHIPDNDTIIVHPEDRPSNAFATQMYDGGTTCDLTKKPRKVQVRYTCDSDVTKSRISSIQETATCEYVMDIATPLICTHEKFRPIQPKLVQIGCHPIISENSKSGDGEDEVQEDSE